MKINVFTRRKFMTTGAIGLLLPYKEVFASQNLLVRGYLDYQDHPKGDKQCSNCYNWIPAIGVNTLGGCRLYPKDTELAPTGYCIAYSPKRT